MKMVYETRKILGDDAIQVCPTCVRVPVSNCHSESILVETERKITVDEARELFADVPGHQGRSTTWRTASTRCRRDCDGDDDVFIGRIREDLSSPNGLAFWCVSDNLRKGAATNAVQIAELLVRRKRLSRCTELAGLKDQRSSDRMSIRSVLSPVDRQSSVQSHARAGSS